MNRDTPNPDTHAQAAETDAPQPPRPASLTASATPRLALRARKPYVAPAFADEIALTAVTLGTMPAINPKQGC